MIWLARIIGEKEKEKQTGHHARPRRASATVPLHHTQCVNTFTCTSCLLKAVEKMPRHCHMCAMCLSLSEMLGNCFSATQWFKLGCMSVNWERGRYVYVLACTLEAAAACTHCALILRLAHSSTSTAGSLKWLQPLSNQCSYSLMQTFAA